MGRQGGYSGGSEGKMIALRASRAALVISGLLWATTLLLGYLKIGPSDLWFVICIYSAVATGLSAVACVITQGLSWGRPKSN